VSGWRKLSPEQEQAAAEIVAQELAGDHAAAEESWGLILGPCHGAG
jgi:hypothetical protein